MNDFAPYWIGLIIAAIIVYQALVRHVPQKNLKAFIDDVYSTENCHVVSIGKLSFNEKIRYAVHLSFMKHFMVSTNLFFGQTEIELYRKIEYADPDEKTKTDVVKMVVTSGSLTDFETLDSYDY